MNIISSISLQNFRGFKETGCVQLAPLTFIVGPNSSGKSTLANALMFIAQSFNMRVATKLSPDWMGRLVDLGSFLDTSNRHAVKNVISIEVGLKINYKAPSITSGRPSPIGKYETRWKWEVRQSPKSEAKTLAATKASHLTISDSTSGVSIGFSYTGAQINLKLANEEIKLRTEQNIQFSENWLVASALKNIITREKSLLVGSQLGYKRLLESYTSIDVPRFFSAFERVTSARSGPKRWVAKDLSWSQNNETGLLNDPYAFDFDISPTNVKRPSNREQISKYLNTLNIASSIERVDLSAYHTSLQVTDSTTGVRSNLADVGFGASQVVPVIKGCVSRSNGPLFIEQPEIHLHPKAQSQLADLICESSATRQLFVETHSEHIINKARILILEKKIKPEDITIIYVNKTKSGSAITQIGIDSEGEFTKAWPQGFFDERYHDTMTLLRLKTKNRTIIDLDKPKATRSKKTASTVHDN
ncbi:Protein of unknown function [Duganella sp. CF458]|uniref:DUF3696 domain-containing protein n=1 Tax=Duganella sp. CF458 TaxID=1884368 RepID=UPI0008F30FFB|nr:DUF3696 domain-containing protein [Duganella sp. CF458]SFF68033.1 Protein of unknown function [Duganella sp. CF458]